MIHIDVLPLYKKYSVVFLYADIPEAERNEVAREVANRILEILPPR